MRPCEWRSLSRIALGVFLLSMGGGCDASVERSDAPSSRAGSSSAASTSGRAAREVIARVGSQIPVPEGAGALRRMLIGRSSRPAFCAAAPFEFEITVPQGADAVSFAVGLRTPGPKGGLAIQVDLQLEVRRGAATLLRTKLDRPDQWYPFWLQLGNEDSPEAATSGAGGKLHLALRGTPALPVCWGSFDFEREPEAGSSAKRPNVLLLSLDTLGAPYLSSHGGMAGVSPRIDAFLGESFEFRRAIAQFGQTLVSHSSLFSAQYPRVHRRYSSEFGTKVPRLDSLMQVVADAGYRTAAFTENGYMSSQFGFDTAFDFYDNGADHVVPGRGHASETFRDAQRWLGERGKDSRFFLFVHTYEVHSPYVPDTEEGLELANSLTPGDRRIFTNEQTHTAFIKHLRGEAPLSKREQKRLLALYNAELRELDGLFGELLDTLERLGLERDTLVVVTADHGEIFGEKGAYAHGVTLHNKILNVPLAFRWPASIEPGSSEEPVQLVDGFLTVLDLLGLQEPEEAVARGVRRDGRSLAPLLSGDADGLEDAPAFSEELRPRPHCRPRDPDPACWIERYSVQSRRYKLVRSRDGSYERFYDLEADPKEIRSPLLDETKSAALEEHRAWLEGYLAATPEIPYEGLKENDPAKGAGGAEELDPEVRARLEALGYVF